MKLKRNILSLFLIAMIFGITPASSIPSVHGQEGVIRVGSKQFTENILLGQMIIVALENAGYQVADFTNFGDTDANREGLLGGAIDVYPEYTGTALSNFFPEQISNYPDGVFQDGYLTYATISSLDAVLNDIIWLRPAPANNRFAIAITREFSEENNLVTMEDFASYVNSDGQIYLAASEDFLFRPDALPSFELTYQFDITGESMFVIGQARPDITETALDQGVNGINAAMAFSTDSLIQEFDLIILEDTLMAQPVFQPTAVFRGDVLKANPNVMNILNPIFDSLDNETLQAINAEIDVKGRDYREVAEEYLRENGFIASN